MLRRDELSVTRELFNAEQLRPQRKLFRAERRSLDLAGEVLERGNLVSITLGFVA